MAKFWTILEPNGGSLAFNVIVCRSVPVRDNTRIEHRTNSFCSGCGVPIRLKRQRSWRLSMSCPKLAEPGANRRARLAEMLREPQSVCRDEVACFVPAAGCALARSGRRRLCHAARFLLGRDRLRLGEPSTDLLR